MALDGGGGEFTPATVLSHSGRQFFPILEGGNAVRFFPFVFFVSGWVSFVVVLPFFSS